MNRDDIIRLMAECSAARTDLRPTTYDGFVDVFAKFAALVAAAEREACAKLVDANADACGEAGGLRDILRSNAAAIRARGRQ